MDIVTVVAVCCCISEYEASLLSLAPKSLMASTACRIANGGKMDMSFVVNTVSNASEERNKCLLSRGRRNGDTSAKA
jgi:hypothetical protein